MPQKSPIFALSGLRLTSQKRGACTPSIEACNRSMWREWSVRQSLPPS